MIDEQKLRDFAQDYIDSSMRAVKKYGKAGARPKRERAQVARALLALLDEMTERPGS